MSNTLEDDNYCFVCGEKNPSGLNLKFSLRDGKILTEFTPQKIHQGYKDIVHGGIISALIDEAMVQAALKNGMPAITAEITIRFKRPLMVGEKTIVEATIEDIKRKTIETSARIKTMDNTLIAEGHAKLLRYD